MSRQSHLLLMALVFFLYSYLGSEKIWAQQIPDIKRSLVQDIQSLLPDSAGDWVKAEPAEIFKGNELFKLIDGGAEIFREYGFNRVIVQRYINENDNIIDVEIYEMHDSSSSYGIFSLFTLNTGKPDTFSSEAYAGDEFLIFRKGIYYISLTGIKLQDKDRGGLLLIGKKIDEMIARSGKPDIVLTFEKLINAKIVLIKGKLGFYNLNILESDEGFKIEEGIYFNTETGRNIILKYKTKEECRKNYISLLSTLKSSSKYRLVNSGTDNNLFLEQKSFLKFQFKNKYILISFSEKKADLDKTVEKLKNELEM